MSWWQKQRAPSLRGADLIYDHVAHPALDEVSSEYGLLAEAVCYPDDISSVTFRLRAEATWHDGTPVTPDDVIFSFNAWKKYSPSAFETYRRVAKVEKTDDRDVTFTTGRRRLPRSASGPRTAQHFAPALVAGTDKRRKETRYRCDHARTAARQGCLSHQGILRQGRNVVYDRVRDYWAANLNVNRGCDNFDELRHEYYRDATSRSKRLRRTISIGASKTARRTGPLPTTPRPSLRNEYFLTSFRSGMSASCRLSPSIFAVTSSKIPEFVAPSITCSISRKRTSNYFSDNTPGLPATFKVPISQPLACPRAKSWRFWKPMRGQIPPEVFTSALRNPVSNGFEAVRDNRREALRLFKEAGYEVRERPARQNH